MKPISPQADRRGVLLLLVLSALTLFLLLGAALLVMATRARTSARAFAAATSSAAIPSLQAQAALEEALLVLIRGSKDAAVKAQVTESLLHDKYGPSLVDSATASIILNTAVPLITGTISGGVDPRKWFGRVITFLPAAGEPGNPASYRIVGASGNTVYVANVPGRPAIPLSRTSGCRINGREFAAEAYDSPDSDPWLTKCVVSAGTVASVSRAAFAGGRTVACDNDNDGVADGVFLDNVIADRPSPNGGTLEFKVSYLVLDLDGRINVNAAGMPDRARGSYAGTPNVPLGMGHGPADLDASLVVSGTPALPHASGTSVFTGSGTNTPTDLWYTYFLGVSGTPTTSEAATGGQRRPPPFISLLGRYGRNGRPGITGDDVAGFQQTTSATTNPAHYALTVAGTNAAADLKGHMRVSMAPPAAGQITPTLTFFSPQSGADAVDDPYEIRLDATGPRLALAVTGTTSVNDDNPFTVADMERVLRTYDPDASTLPPRLAAGLGNVAEASRMRITTDSWDTPALTGSAATKVEESLSGTGANPMSTILYPWADTNPASPDVAAGLRFNLNRPIFTSPDSGTAAIAREASERREYCKGLFTLAVQLGLGQNPATTAQWAANVVDFRDDDSTMTGFEYDTNLANGWDVDGDPATTTDTDRGIVWGVERPELLIAETAAWRETLSGSSQLFVNLIRPPWTATLVTGTSSRSVEQLHADLGAANNLDLAANGAWQLRFTGTGQVAGTTVVQFGAVTGSSAASQYVYTGTTVTNGSTTIVGGPTAVAALAPGDRCIIAPANPQHFSVTANPKRCDVSQGGAFAPAVAVNVTSGTVWLERLADPSRANGADNPYVRVDAAPFEIRDFTTPPVSPLASLARPTSGTDGLKAFWCSPTAWDTSGPTVGTYSVSGTMPWFHWPNRPFVSQAELALVPADSGEKLLKNYSFPTTSLVASGTGELLLDATYVPSRFAGCAVTVTNTSALAVCGLDRLQANHFFTWREPGRVNVNTIPTGTSGVVDADSLVWATLIGGTSLPLTSGTLAVNLTVNPFVSSGTTAASPATSMAHLLSLSGSAGQPIATGTFQSGTASGLRDTNPFFAYATAIRLANTATVRSNVFAVWITVEVTDTSANAPPPTYRRLFAIVDRSIPVGYSEGENLNVRDTIRLQRYLD